MVFTAFGVRVGIRTNKPEFLEAMQERFPPRWTPVSASEVNCVFSLKVGGRGVRRGEQRFHLLYKNYSRLGRTLDLNEALDIFEAGVKIHVANKAQRRVFVHAGVVGWKGKAIVIPGRSYSGKSTLVAELVKAGATYYSDEYAVLDAQGRVHPYAIPLSIREGELNEQKKYPVEVFGGVRGVKPLPVGLVVVSEFRKGATWRPRRVPAGQGVLELLSNTVSARRQPGAAFCTLQKVVLQAPVLKGIRGEAREIVESLLCLL